jgi:hypothetical protein
MARLRTNHKSKTQNQPATKGGKCKHITKFASKSIKQQQLAEIGRCKYITRATMRSWYEHIGSFIGGIHDDVFMCCVWPLLVDDEANKGL